MEKPSESNELQSQPAVLKAVIQITRKATGKVEEYTLIGAPEEVKTQAERIPAKED